MRRAITISLPQKTAQLLKKRVASVGYESASQYIQHLVQLDNDESPFISEKQLLQIIKEGDAEYARGKTIKNKTLRDLV